MLLPVFSLLSWLAAPAAPPAISLQRERDQIYAWLAYAVVYQDWQPTAQPDSSRGYNIGSVLVNADGYVVHWGRNCINATRNLTQHGEVRLMQSYLQRTRQRALRGYTIYTTLEPCAMCSGMMTLTQVTRTVFGQSDPEYGNALQRLQLDSRACGPGHYGPYPRAVEVSQAPDAVSCAIDSAYDRHRAERIVQFLASAAVRPLYARAAAQLARYRAQHPDNQVRLDSARRFLARLPKTEELR
ncbi:nucleoside deaminase [Hymenobacter sp. 15J16-1T3B]|uniref:nucleoside deaminase n=1 Tax=Hymenobacter sp. 15J16-1T3B TaxID=2886941 RepID=UPI001D117DCF|nr:nucleoside deaminase [Hymenobacter sp. 15J16-1T3B]MCC3157411.1 nucleoside deaminase [Hymenobacter sp. 15J16-1T3B]